MTLEFFGYNKQFYLYLHHCFLKCFFKSLYSRIHTVSDIEKKEKAQFCEQLGQPGGSPSPQGRCLMPFPHQILALVSILLLAPQELIQADNPERNWLLDGQIFSLRSICKYCSLCFCFPCIPAFFWSSSMLCHFVLDICFTNHLVLCNRLQDV